MTDLRETFRVSDVDQSELETVIQMHFSHVQAPNPYEIRCGRDQAAPALILRYGKESGQIKEIESGPSLTQEDISQIAEKVQTLLLGPTEFRIGQGVLFSRLAFNSWFRYRDRFQLIPVPPEAPRPTVPLSGGHPLLLQYRFGGSSNAYVQTQRQCIASRELELLCVALSQHIVGSIPTTNRYHWSLVGQADAPTRCSEHCLEAYYWPGFTGGIAKEYSTVAAWNPTPRLPHEEYYRQLGISVGQEMTLPDSFEELLDAYFRLTSEERDRFIRASHWYQFAGRAAGESYTARYSALCSAVEALMGPEPPGQPKCAKCGRTSGGGVRQRFREFLKRWAPGPTVTEADRQKLYTLRAKATHGGHLLHGDRFAWGGGFSPAGLEDWSMLLSMWRLVRIILVNWLAGTGSEAGSGSTPNPEGRDGEKK
jgi:hypothetical protein